MSRRSNYIPVSNTALGISGLLQTPTDFYRDGRTKAPQRIVKDKYSYLSGLDNMMKTPNNFYGDISTSLKFKVSNGMKKIFNPNTNRWILDSKLARDRIAKLEQITSKNPTKSKMTMKKQSSKKIISEPKEPQTPLYPDGLTLDICSKYSRNLEINLGDIKMDSDKMSNTVKINYGRLKGSDRVIPGFLQYKGIPLNNIEYISKGSYGTVWKYSSDYKLKPGWQAITSKSTGGIYYMKNGKNAQWEIPIDTNYKFYQIAVKTYKSPYDDEINLVNSLNRNGKRGTCNLINSKIMQLRYKGRNTIVSAMDLMDGTLSNLISIPLEDKLKIIQRAAKHLECIRNISKGSAYTDLKAANILYKCYKNNKMKIVIGDIGGLCSHPSETGSATFPPPETLGKKPNCSEATMVWDLGVTFLEMINYDVMDLFYWDAAKDYSETEFGFASDNAIEELIVKNGMNDYSISNGITLGYLLESMFEVNPNKRITLKQIEDIFTGKYTKPIVEVLSDSDSDSDDWRIFKELYPEVFEYGYDKNGYDKNGYDKNGYDVNGYDKDGITAFAKSLQ